MAIEKNIGRKIKDRRKLLKMTQEQLGILASLDRGYISEIENGRKNFSIQTLHKIANALRTTLEDLVKDDSESP